MIDSVIKFKSIALKGSQSSVITDQGRLFIWGYNREGQAGDGTKFDKKVPEEVTEYFHLYPKEVIRSVSLGGFHSSVLTSLGRLFTWGQNEYGKLGDGTKSDRIYPKNIAFRFNLLEKEKIVNVDLGLSHSTALTSKGRVFTWGHNGYGQLGVLSSNDINLPHDITHIFDFSSNEKIIYLSTGDWHTIAISNMNRVFSWGYNCEGQLGDGTKEDKNEPNDITNMFNLMSNEIITEVSVMGFNSLAISNYGRVYIWGRNSEGQLGNEKNDNSTTPIDITAQFKLLPDERVKSISLGGLHASVITNKSRLLIWGRNKKGQLGNGTNIDSKIPIDITSNLNLHVGESIKCVSLGGDTSSALTTFNRVFTWGSNFNGQLGIGNLVDQNLPQEVTFQINNL